MMGISSLPGNPNLLLGAYDLATLGYEAEEFVVSGTARSYANDETADYVTRIVVCRPSGETNGTAVVEWLNVSGGIDAPAVWLMAHREIARAGYTYVAVSAQFVGIEGGDNLIGIDMSLKAQASERYSQLKHPGDQFSYDIFSQVGRLVRDGDIDGLQPKAVLAVGESQSAMFLTTYVNEVDPDASVFDGFLVHSRFGPAAPLGGGSALEESRPAPFRDDLRVPVLSVITETDLVDGHLLGYHHARRPDNDRLRVWEIPGTEPLSMKPTRIV